MPLIQVGLVDTTQSLDPDFVQAVAAALNVQVMRDLPQFWDVQATVLFLPNPARVPVGVWPVQLVDQLPPGEGGFHQSKNNQPFAMVAASSASDDWTIAASHETLEMLVDPSGNKLQASRAIEIVDGNIQDTTGEFEYLVELGDPSEAPSFAYSIQGVAVSDFLTPHFYDPVATPGTRYSFTGAIKAPRQILPGGYISWVNPELGDVQQLRFIDPDSPPTIVDLGSAQGLSLRVWVDAQTVALTTKHRKPNQELLAKCKEHRAKLDRCAVARSKRYQTSKA